MGTEDPVARASRLAAWAKDRELAAHERAVEVHQQAAQFQQDIGRDDLAEVARRRATRAQDRHQLAQTEMDDPPEPPTTEDSPASS